MSQVIETLRMTESTLRSSKIDFTFVALGAASPKKCFETSSIRTGRVARVARVSLGLSAR